MSEENANVPVNDAAPAPIPAPETSVTPEAEVVPAADATPREIQGAGAQAVGGAPADQGETVAETTEVTETAVASGDLLTADAMPLLQVVEALLFSSDMPLSAAKLADTCGVETAKAIKEVVAELNTGYEARQAAYRIEERAGGYQLLTLPQYAGYIERLVRKKDEGRLTPAMLETLAIVAYRQPIIRADVEAIRGVACGEVLRVLMEHNLAKIVGRADIVGRPMLYGTTRYFLEVFGLANIKDLPKSEQLKDPSAGA